MTNSARALRVRLAFTAATSLILVGTLISPRQAFAQLPLPPLPGSLVVTITSPASGSTVARTITVSASVSTVGLLVAGVQFKLDGANIGAEDTAAPYAVAWDTTTTGNGSHTLTAVARDALGARFTSSPVTVTVSNAPPPDTTAPTVAITSPASGSTVSGPITVSAGASDNVGVAGVQFRLDGASLGAEDTAAPYSVAWDTRSSSNGSHALTAVARDAAGNRGTSATVTVMVSNGPPPPPPGATRFEETDPSVTFTAGWTQGSTARPWSGGTAAITATAGAKATFNFTGTTVSWIGFRGPQSGIARVSMDGAFVAEVDTYAAAEEVEAVVFTTAGLADAGHTLTIEVTGLKNSASTDAFIVVDAFEAKAAAGAPPPPPPPGASRFEETDPSVTFTAGWSQGNTSRPWSGGTAAISAAGGARATFAFAGPSVGWIGFRGPQTGIARVFLDGGLVTEVDTYSATEEVGAVVFTATGLADTSHSLTIEVVGLKNPASTDATIVVDAFEAKAAGSGSPPPPPPPGSTTRFEEKDPAVTYTGTWFDSVRADHSGGLAQKSYIAGARASFTFTGTGVRWIGFRASVAGKARVFLDGALAAEVDAYAPVQEPQAVMFEATGLSREQHALVIEVMGTYNPSATAAWIAVDAFDVIP